MKNWDHVLIEFKYSESVNQDVLFQALSYRHLYLKVQKLKPERLHTVIISSKTPSQKFRMDFGYQESYRLGVWRSNNIMLGILHILVLNDLSDAPHNLFIKCFASRKKEKERSFRKLFEFSWKQLSASLLHISMILCFYARGREKLKKAGNSSFNYFGKSGHNDPISRSRIPTRVVASSTI